MPDRDCRRRNPCESGEGVVGSDRASRRFCGGAMSRAPTTYEDDGEAGVRRGGELENRPNMRSRLSGKTSSRSRGRPSAKTWPALFWKPNWTSEARIGQT